MKELQVEVITPSKTALNIKAESVTIPGTLGSFQVLFNHAPIISTFEIGVIKIVENGNVLLFATGGGTVDVVNNKILILAESFETNDEIDADRAEKALKRAKDRLSKKNQEIVDEQRAEAALRRAINRLKFIGKY